MCSRSPSPRLSLTHTHFLSHTHTPTHSPSSTCSHSFEFSLSLLLTVDFSRPLFRSCARACSALSLSYARVLFLSLSLCIAINRCARLNYIIHIHPLKKEKHSVCSCAQACTLCLSLFLCLSRSHSRSLSKAFPMRCCSVLQCVAVCCSVLQCVAVCCSVLQCVAVCEAKGLYLKHSSKQCCSKVSYIGIS